MHIFCSHNTYICNGNIFMKRFSPLQGMVSLQSFILWGKRFVFRVQSVRVTGQTDQAHTLT
jgi:hypothetical protein